MLLNDKEIDIFVGSKIGTFKHVKYYTDPLKNNKKCIENLQDVKTLVKGEGVTSMIWGNEDQTEIIIGKKNQQIQIYDTEENKFTKSYTADFGEGEVVGLGKWKRRLITALSSGIVKIWSKKVENEIVVETGGPLDRLRCCPDDSTIFGTGGNENELKLWRIGESKPVFQAKNLPHDWLQLRQPVWVSDLCFLPESGGKLVATCSRYGYVRLYDTRVQRRPVSNVEFKPLAATCIAPSFDERQVIVGFGRGQLHQVDLRNKGKPDKGYKGSVGSVMDVVCISTSPRLLASVSLDRFLKIHDYNTKQLIYKEYLTSKLSNILVQTLRNTPLLKAEVKQEEEIQPKSEDEMDELFNNMGTVKERSKKRPEASESIIEIADEDPEVKIRKLLKSTEKKKKKMAQKKREKKSKSIYHNA